MKHIVNESLRMVVRHQTYQSLVQLEYVFVDAGASKHPNGGVKMVVNGPGPVDVDEDMDFGLA